METLTMTVKKVVQYSHTFHTKYGYYTDYPSGLSNYTNYARFQIIIQTTLHDKLLALPNN